MSEFNPYQPPASSDEPLEDVPSLGDEQGPEGLGGWLILVAIGIVVSPFRIGAMVLITFVPIFTDGTWEILTTPGSAQYNSLWGPLLLFEIGGNLVFMVGYTVLAFMFFRKSRLFPKVYIALSFINLGFVVFDAWFATLVLPDEPMFDPETTKEVVRSLISTAVWVPYMLVSKRVRNTFVS